MVPTPAHFSLLPAISLLRELASHRELARRTDLEFRLRSQTAVIAAELESERISAQKEIALAVLDAARHAFDRKLDFFVRALEAIGAQTARCMATLNAELSGLRQRATSASLGREERGLVESRMADLLRQVGEVDRLHKREVRLLGSAVERIRLDLGGPPARLAGSSEADPGALS